MAELIKNLAPSTEKAIIKFIHDDLSIITHHIGDNLQKWSMFSDIGNDLDVISNSLTNVKQALGSNNHALFSDVWSGLNELYNSFDGIDFDNIVESNQKATLQIVKLQDQCTKHEKYWSVLGNNWIPGISNLESSYASLKSISNEQLG